MNVSTPLSRLSLAAPKNWVKINERKPRLTRLLFKDASGRCPGSRYECSPHEADIPLPRPRTLRVLTALLPIVPGCYRILVTRSMMLRW